MSSIGTMPSADFSSAVKVDYSALSGFQLHAVSQRSNRRSPRVRTLNFPRVNAQFIKREPIADGRLKGYVPSGLTHVTPNIGFLSIAPRFCLGLPSDIPSRVCPCPLANLRLCEYLVSGLSPD